MSEPLEKPIPAPPAGVTDPEQLAGGEERWEHCPLKDCKRDPELLYEDFYLRGMRSDRLLCSKCAVRVEVGYMAREEVRKADDKFFQGSAVDDLIVLGLMFFASIVGNALAIFVPSFYIEIFLGGAIGAGAAGLSRTITEGRVSRGTHYWGTAGIIAGAIFALLFGRWALVSIVICTGAMIAASWGIFLRRI
ncbi:MAG: hypothetical protein Phog2KO_44100 [Phototrophicaceae bacterium]